MPTGLLAAAKAGARGFWHSARRAYRQLSFADLVWVFLTGCIIGFISETVCCYIGKGVLESRKGMLYGPFNQVYGFGALAILLCLLPFQASGFGCQFLVGALVGGLFEVLCGLFEEIVIGTRSWGYSEMRFSFFGGRTNLLYMAFWGLLAAVYMQGFLPFLLRQVHRIPYGMLQISSVAIAVFFVVNLSLSAMAIGRWTARLDGVVAETRVERVLDRHYPNERMERIYPSMKPLAAPPMAGKPGLAEADA